MVLKKSMYPSEVFSDLHCMSIVLSLFSTFNIFWVVYPLHLWDLIVYHTSIISLKWGIKCIQETYNICIIYFLCFPRAVDEASLSTFSNTPCPAELHISLVHLIPHFCDITPSVNPCIPFIPNLRHCPLVHCKCVAWGGLPTNIQWIDGKHSYPCS